MVMSRDVIGWTNEEDYTLISYNFDGNYEMRFHSFVSFPAVNETVPLDDVVFPGVFSVAVEIIAC